MREFSARSILSSEYDRFFEFLIIRFGNPLESTESSSIWDWNARPLVFGTDDIILGVALTLPSYIGLTQDQWDQYVEFIKLME